MRKRFHETQIIGILKEQDSGATVSDICRCHGISDGTFYDWKSKYGGMEVSEAKRLKSLEDENRRLKRLVAHLSLDKVMLQDGKPCFASRHCDGHAGSA
ncbi:MAG: transposase [Alphaproteobacteria bacterium]|nr:transposase [Alphaproteobacteria bacterium]